MKREVRNIIYTKFSPIILFTIIFSLAFSGGSTLIDKAESTHFQDSFADHFKRGRADIGADFDLDGKIDYFIGNPGNESFILHNETNDNGRTNFSITQILLVDSLAWGGVAFDYDNDGDYDLFVPCGANEGVGFDYLFRNDWIMNGQVTGILHFTNVTSEAGVAGPIPDGKIQPIRTASANAVVADYDQDGDDDLFVNGNIVGNNNPGDCSLTNLEQIELGIQYHDLFTSYPELVGRNTLWQNNGDGTFTDVTMSAGLGDTLAKTRHSTFLDFDNDGDADLYENNHNGHNILWRNNGDGTFTNVTSEMSPTGEDLSYPLPSFASGSADFNNDGWEDIIAFNRGASDDGSPYPLGHAIFLNRKGSGFVNVGEQSGINYNLVTGNHGVMGCQVGDINGDGTPDLFFGNGGPPFGATNLLFFSLPTGPNNSIPLYTDVSYMIDFPSEIPAGLIEPPYPYRTHGTTFTDVDGDGILEITVVNGGPARSQDITREPNRLFKMGSIMQYNYVFIRPIGDGLNVSKDAIGSRIALTVSEAGQRVRTIYRTLFGGSCFSAQNGFEVHFGLGESDTIEELKITWPDGKVTTITEGLVINSKYEILYNSIGTSVLLKNGDSKTIEDIPLSYQLNQNYPNPFNPTTTISFSVADVSNVSIDIYNIAGEKISEIVNEQKSAGNYTVQWDASKQPSGVYFYKLQAGNFVKVKKMILLR